MGKNGSLSAESSEASLVSKLVHKSVHIGFRRAYRHVRLDPQKYLRHVQRVYQLPIERWQDVHDLDERLLHDPAARIITASSKTAALEGMGLGLGGLATILPDMGILSAITMRMLQKLSLVHGFEYSTEEEITALWLAAASAAGVDFAREYFQKQAVDKVVPMIIDRLAAKIGSEVAEKWAGRVLPIVSIGAGGALNYYFVRTWGRRAHRHFLERHRSVRAAGRGPLLESSTA